MTDASRLTGASALPGADIMSTSRLALALWPLVKALGLTALWLAVALSAGAVVLLALQAYPVFADRSANAILTNTATLVASALVFAAAGLRIGFVAPFRGGLEGGRIGPAVMIALAVMAYAAVMSHLSSASLPKFDALLLQQHLALFAIQAIAMCLLVPYGEELLFRGWLWCKLSPAAGVLAAGLITTAVWVLIHAPTGWFTVLALIPVGILIAVVRHRTGGLLAPLAIHVVYNATAQASHLVTLFYLR